MNHIIIICCTISLFGFLLVTVRSATSEPAKKLTTDYCKLTCDTATRPGRHLLCHLYEHDKTCRPRHVTRLSKENKQRLVNEHNRLRNTVALWFETRGSHGPQPRAANMMALRWDTQLEDVAAQLVVECNFHPPTWCMDVPRFKLGMNWFYDQNSTDSSNLLTDGFNVWENEVKYLPGNDTKRLEDISARNTSHYGQIVAGVTERIGCATARAKDSTDKHRNLSYLACVYGPKGPNPAHRLYQEGQSCTKCPAGSHCSKRWNGLCARPVEVGLRNAQDAIYIPQHGEKGCSLFSAGVETKPLITPILFLPMAAYHF